MTGRLHADLTWRPMKSTLKRSVPRRIRPAARKVYYFPTDTLDFLLGRWDALTPPKGKIFFAGGDFEKIGNQFFRYFLGLGDLKPDERALDVGAA